VNSAKTAKLKSPPNLDNIINIYFCAVIKKIITFWSTWHFRGVNKDEDDKKLPVLPVPKEILLQ